MLGMGILVLLIDLIQNGKSGDKFVNIHTGFYVNLDIFLMQSPELKRTRVHENLHWFFLRYLKLKQQEAFIF